MVRKSSREGVAVDAFFDVMRIAAGAKGDSNTCCYECNQQILRAEDLYHGVLSMYNCQWMRPEAKSKGAGQ